MPKFTIGPLPGQPNFGAVVTGLTPDMIDDPAVRKSLYDLWLEKGVVVFKGLSGLETQLRLSAVYGEPEEHPLLRGVDQKRTHHVIADIEFDKEDGDLYVVKGELRGGYLPWHFDLAYVDKINHGGIMRPHILPKRGGETGFIDQVAAFEALPADLQKRVEGLNVIYAFQTDSSKAKFGDRPEKCVRLSQRIQRAMSHPSVQRRAIHPLVYTQESSGKKVLRISPWHAVGIEGMETPEGDALLRTVIDYSIRPERAYFHKWQADEMVLWDNWRMMHCACGVPEGEERKMGRTTIAGDYALGRYEVSEAA